MEYTGREFIVLENTTIRSFGKERNILVNKGTMLKEIKGNKNSNNVEIDLDTHRIVEFKGSYWAMDKEELKLYKGINSNQMLSLAAVLSENSISYSKELINLERHD